MRSISHAVKVVVALAATLPSWVMSAGLPPDGTPLQVSGVAGNPPAIVTGMGPAMSAERLGNFRGGTDIVSNDMQLSGTVGGNSAVNVTTGMNTINGGAFTNASGFPTVIQNTGANVLIQNATIVNLQMK